MEHGENICRLCLRKSVDFNKYMDGNTKKCLDMLLIDINLDVSEEPMMCTNCAAVLQKCYDFKTSCLAAKLDLKDAYLNISEYKNVDCATGDYNVCCFCMGLINNCPFISLENEYGDVLSVKTTLEKCLPELDISIIKKPTVCVPCHACLEDYLRFMANCKNAEETIKRYCESGGTNSKGQIELIDVLGYSLKNMLQEGNVIEKEDHKNTHFIRIKNDMSNDEEYRSENCISEGIKRFENIGVEKGFYETKEIVKAEIGNKRENVTKIEDQEFNGVLHSNNKSKFKEDGLILKLGGEFWKDDETEVEPTTEYFIKLEDRQFLLCDDKAAGIKMKQHGFNSSPDDVVLPQLSKSYDIPQTSTKKDISDAKMHQCPSCSYKTNKRYSLNLHLLVHKKPSEVPLHRCEFCPYQSVNKNNLRKHLLVHKDPSEIPMYKCEICPYQAKQINDLRKHLIVHKDPLDIKMYNCESCSFQTKYKKALNVHKIIHQNPAEITMYQCDSCSFQTIHKRSLQGHMLVHKDASEITIYQCDSCAFQTKHKKSLAWHNITHKDPSAEKLYKCEACSYQSNNKSNLTRHLVVHKDPLEINMYRCKTCSFQTKTSAHLRNHLLIHKDPSEVTMYKCELCAYQTKVGSSLRRHLLVHKDPSDITMYKCQSCSFQTKHKKALDTHNVAHNNNSGIAMYQCPSCSFNTKYKMALNRHMLTHKDQSEIIKYKCEFCSYQTKITSSLRKHMLAHKEPSDKAIYRCQSCSFQAKHEKGLQSHMLTHKGLSNDKG